VLRNTHEVKDLFAERGLKVTHQRIAIYNALVANFDHPTVDELYQHVRMECPSLSLATLYKTLELFAEKGLAVRVATHHGAQRYEPARHRHHHLMDSQSGSLQDYENEELTNLLSTYFAKNPVPGFNIQDFQLVLLGELKNDTKTN